MLLNENKVELKFYIKTTQNRLQKEENIVKLIQYIDKKWEIKRITLQPRTKITSGKHVYLTKEKD